MALDNQVVAASFTDMITHLPVNLTAEEVADRMSDWIIASSVTSTVHFMKKLPTKPEAGKIYLLKTGQYIIHNPDPKGKSFTGSLFNISKVPETLADRQTKKLRSNTAILQLKTQLADLKINRKNPEFIVQVIKITTKLGHNPLEAQKQNEVRKKCFNIIHPDKLSPQSGVTPTKEYLLGRIMANKEPVAADFYATTVNTALQLQAKPAPKLSFSDSIGVLITHAKTSLVPLIVQLINVFYSLAILTACVFIILNIAAPIYAASYATAFFIAFSAALLKEIVVMPIISCIASTFFSPYQAAMIPLVCSAIMSALLAYQFFLAEFLISAALFSARILLNGFTILSTTIFVLMNKPVNEQVENYPAYSAFIKASFKKAQEQSKNKTPDLPPVVEPINPVPPVIGAAFKNDKDKKKANAAKKNDKNDKKKVPAKKKAPAAKAPAAKAPAAKAANDEKPAKKRRSPSPSRAAVEADGID